METIFYFTLLSWIASLNVVVICMPTGTPETEEMDEPHAINYFTKYHYMGDDNPDSQFASLTDIKAYPLAIRNFQRFFGLNETGILDEETKALMSMPRCGMADITSVEDNSMSMGNRRKKRYAHEGSRWSKTDITYTIRSFSQRLSQDIVESEIKRAFDAWEMVTPLRFTQTSRNPDIIIIFAVGEHGDGDGFDGRGGTLAHAYFPRYGGDAHFDDSEIWTFESYQGTNLFQVVVHEIGHSLGLAHSGSRRAVMAPFYAGYDSGFGLHQDDIDGIQSIYGKPSSRTTTTTTTTTRKPRPGQPITQPPRSSTTTARISIPDIRTVCEAGKFETITQTLENGELKTYGFYKNLYMLLVDDGIAPGYPKLISDGWPGLEDNLDASIYIKPSYSTYWTWINRRWELKTVADQPARTYFFKGNKYWRADDGIMKSGYPQSITDNWKGLPANIDAAFVWSRNGKAYFVKGDQYYRFGSDKVDRGYPRPFSVWTEELSSVDSAVQWNQQTYFFSGNQYYRYNDEQIELAPGYPKSTSKLWLGCDRFTQALTADGDSSVNSSVTIKTTTISPTVFCALVLMLAFIV